MKVFLIISKYKQKLIDISVNLNKEYFDASIYLDMIWKDRRLKWDRDKYNGIHSIRVSTAEVWKPDLEVMNRVQDFPLVDEKMPRIGDSRIGDPRFDDGRFRSHDGPRRSGSTTGDYSTVTLLARLRG